MINNDNIPLKNIIREEARTKHFTLSDEMRNKIRVKNQQDKSPLKHFIDKTKSIADEVLNEN